MNQALLDLPTAAAALPGAPIDRIGFEIGWDHAHHSLVPPAELLLDGMPLGQGWRAGKAVFGSRTLKSTPHTRAWLMLRMQAWRGGISFDTHQVTPHYLSQIRAETCPVLRTLLGGATGAPDAAVIDRLNSQAGYAIGNLAVMSGRAAKARHGVSVLEALRRAARITAGGHAQDAIDGLDAAHWLRLAALRSFATPLPFAEAARLPLAVLPGRRMRMLNAVQGLQVLLTTQFATPGWSARTRAVAALLPEHTLRHDYNLFIGAIAPRVMEAATSGAPIRQVLEDAWLNERVQRRWQHFVLSLGETATAALLQRATALGLTDVRTTSHAAERATAGWALADGARAQDSAALTPQAKLAPWQTRAARLSRLAHPTQRATMSA